MKLMQCPINGTRPISEFAYGGTYKAMPDPNSVDDITWAQYVFNKAGSPGLKCEWWCHTPSTTWFIALRDTLKDEVINTFLFSEEVIEKALAEGGSQ